MTNTHGEPVRLVLGEFEDIISRGLCAMIDEDTRLRLVASGVGNERLAAALAESVPDVAIINFGSLSNPAELRDLHHAFPGTRLVVLADRLSASECSQLLALGASTCLPKSAEAHELVEAICSDSRGDHAPFPTAPEPVPGAPLTPREVEVLELLRSGHSNAEIAATLHVGFQTLRTHTSSIYAKLGVSCRRELRTGEVAVARSHHETP